MNPIRTALNGKGLLTFLRRSVRIARRYGWSPAKMDRALAQFVTVLRRFDCGATFPITSVTLERNSGAIIKYQAQGIEFAVHGYQHVDHSQLSEAEQLAQLTRARQVFAQAGLQPQGFRGPYLRWNSATLASLRQQGFAYDSSQALAWDVVGDRETPAYRHVLSFYGAKSAGDYPSLPRLEEQLVHIPYSVPDDEALVERLALPTAEQMSPLWLAILDRTYQLGELFVLGLHPERIAACREPLSAVLSRARSLSPAVWIARLDEIAGWWQARAKATVEITETAQSEFHLAVAGPNGTTMLARACQVDVPTLPWANDYQRVEAATFAVRAPRRPFIGLAPGASPKLAAFLRQQGYIIEISERPDRYSFYFDRNDFTAEHERTILAQVEGTSHPLVRLARWPRGARSALAITGDVDALTLWDYGLRLLGR